MNQHREVWKRDKAIEHFKKAGEIYKAEILKTFQRMKNYQFIFMENGMICVGPHLSSTGKSGKFFKLNKVSGAYWRGDSNNEMLTKNIWNFLDQHKKILMNI